MLAVFIKIPCIFINSYLIGRKQRTKINFFCSAFAEILFGVPRGSILGPLIFNIYICAVTFILKMVTLTLLIMLMTIHRMGSFKKYVRSKLPVFDHPPPFPSLIRSCSFYMYFFHRVNVHIGLTPTPVRFTSLFKPPHLCTTNVLFE